jgi:hypothetical protein
MRLANGLVVWPIPSISNTQQFGFIIYGHGKVRIKDAHVVLGNRYDFVPSAAMERVWTNSSGQNVETTGSGPPATSSDGTWSRGDRAWNTAPAATGPLGWVCVTSGTPGTWRAFE